MAYISNSVGNDKDNPYGIYYSLTQVAEASETGTNKLYLEDSDVYKACKVFFDCGGQCIKLIKAEATGASQSLDDAAYKTVVEKLPIEIIAFACKKHENLEGTSNKGLSKDGRSALVTYLDGLEALDWTSVTKSLR